MILLGSKASGPGPRLQLAVTLTREGQGASVAAAAVLTVRIHTQLAQSDVLGIWGRWASCLTAFFIAPGGEARASSHLGTVAGRPSLGEARRIGPP